MPPKRKRASASPKETASSGTTSTSVSKHSLNTLLQEIRLLSQDKSRCKQALEALVQGKCGFGSVEDTSKQNVDCYWIILATHTLHRVTKELLLVNPKKNKEDDKNHLALVASVLCHALSSTLLSDRFALEKCANAAASMDSSRLARSVVGRAIVDITIGSTVTLSHSQDSNKLLWACLQSLEKVIHLSNASPPKPHSGDESWNTKAQPRLDLILLEQDNDDEQELSNACTVVSRILKFHQMEQACVAALCKSAKPARRSSRNKEDAGLQKQFQTLLDTHVANAIVIDGRVSIRRWASMSFVWLCRGQESVLKVVMQLLSNADQYMEGLECAALEIETAETTQATGSSPRGGKKRDSNKSAALPVRIPGSVALVALACRLVDVLSESGNACGVRAPTGGMDAYAATLLSSSSPPAKQQRKSPSKKSGGGHTWTRPDVRNAATVVLYWLIQAHTECLESNCSASEGLLGDGNSRSVIATDGLETARYYPFCQKSLDTLCRAAASSVVSSASVDASDSIRRLLGIASSWSLAAARTKMDAKLTTFGMSHLTDLLRSLLNEDETCMSSSTSGDAQDYQQYYQRLETKYNLEDPLPVPTMPKVPAKSRKKKSDSSNESTVCTFGGVFAPPPRGVEQTRISDEQVLSLHLRALENDDADNSTEALFSKLLDIVERSYDTPLESQSAEAQAEEEESSRATRAGTKKRTARKKATGGKTKRRKVGKSKEDATAQVVDGNGEKAKTLTNRTAISSTRAGLATDAMNALRMCLFHPPTHGSTNPKRFSLRLSLRQFLTTNHICFFVEHGKMLDEVLIKARIVSESRKTGKTGLGRGAASFFSGSGDGDFAHTERSLWVSHINLSETIGRGHPSYDPRRHSSTTEPIMGNSTRRLAVFREVALCGSGGPEQWPLCLPAVHHALVASNLASEPLKTSRDEVSPERFIADSFMSSMSSALADLSIVEKWNSSYGNDIVMPQEHVPLSLRDARLFVLAVCRLPGEEQRDFLRKLVDVLSSFCSKTNEAEAALIASSDMVSGFLARAITVCVTLVNAIYVAPSLREALFLQVGPTQYQLPTVSISSRKLEDSLRDDSWYTRERHFMGLFSDWQSPTIPEVPLPDSPTAVDPFTVLKLNKIFETLLRLGFASANVDKCHLLFAAWNASGKARAWDQRKPGNRKLDVAPIPEDQFPRLLMELRDDMCHSHREIHGSSGAIPDSLLSSVLQQRDKGEKATKPIVKEILKKMLAKAESLVDSVVGDGNAQNQELPTSSPLAAFALLEAVSVYIGFVVAEHTKPGKDLFSNGVQSRNLSGGSAESLCDYPDFDDEFDEDARIGAMARLHDACARIGASPTHPDWLDESCRLRETMTASEAVDVAETALKCLSKLASFAYARYIQSCYEALTIFTESGTGRERRSALALQLCCAVRNEKIANSTDKSDQFIDAISRVCHVEKTGLDFLVGNAMNSTSSESTWCPATAQRIQGRLEDRRITIDGWDPMQCELRAGGEWELLLSSCLDLDLNIRPVSGDSRRAGSRNGRIPEQFREGMTLFIASERWRRVCETSIGSLVPAAALLRFGLGLGRGRKPHPLNCLETETNPGTSLRFTENVPCSTTVPEETKGLVLNAVALLSRISSTCQFDSVLRRSCSSAATHLLVDSESHVDLEGMQSLSTTFTTLFSLRDMFRDETPSRRENASLRVIVEMLVFVIEAQGYSEDSAVSSRCELAVSSISTHQQSSTDLSFVRVLGLLGLSSVLTLESIVGSSKPTELFASANIQQDSWRQLLSEWQWEAPNERVVSEMVSLLVTDELHLNSETRYRLSRILAAVAELEHHYRPSMSSSPTSHSSFLLREVSAAFASAGDDCIKKLVMKDLCLLPFPSKGSSLSDKRLATSQMLSVLFAFTAFDDGGHILSKRILATLLDTVDQWAYHNKSAVLGHAFDLLFLLGTRFDQLVEIGSKLLSSTSLQRTVSEVGQSEPDLIAVERFLRFVRDTDRALQNANATASSLQDAGMPRAGTLSNVAMQGGNPISRSPANVDSSASNTLRLCSYARQKNFHDQHWYNCYTCGLLWDRGCCSICARVCHRGHDVAYSRFSSFFCDCGAENESDSDRVSCKCLTPLLSEQVESIVGEEDSTSFFKSIGAENVPGEDCQDSQRLSNDDSAIEAKWVTMASEFFAMQARSSVSNFKRKANEMSWSKLLLSLVRRHFESWQDKTLDLLAYGEAEVPSDEIPGLACLGEYVKQLETLRDAIHARKGKALDLQALAGKGMVPIRAAKANCFKMRLSSDRKTSKVAVVTDSRGRLIIAEHCSLLLCSAFPAVNGRHAKSSPETALGRAQMVGSSSSLNFNIVGMQIRKELERHLVVWGTEEACIVVLSPLCDRVEKSIDLVFDLEPECDTDYLLGCEWIPGSHHVAVACGPFVKIFSLERAENESRLLPVTCYSLASEAALCDVAMVPTFGEDGRILAAQMFLLLDSGQVHVVELKMNSSGDLEENGERYLDPSEGISLPTAGVRLYQGASPSAPDSISRSIGEGSTCGLCYLSQSGLLLYSCVSSCVMALLLDSKGSVSGSFELLPHVVSSNVLGTGSNGYNICGPFTHWTELGMVEEDNSLFFRVACVGKSSKTGQPKILCVDLNHEIVKVKELSWTAGNSLGLGLSLSSSFDGLAAFSAPVMANEKCYREPVDGENIWNERAFLAAITSNGAMLFFGEETDISRSLARGSKVVPSPRRRRAMSDSVINRPETGMETARNNSLVQTGLSDPSFPLTIFEGLINASDFDGLSYVCEGSDSDSIKSKLSSKTSGFFLVPSRDGCTLQVAVRPDSEVLEASGSDVHSKLETSEVSIVAFRILVGSTTTDSIPRHVLIEGRPFELKRGVKRWYDIPLTHQEVALSIRNGFVSLGVGPQHDVGSVGNNPVVDAVEVYVTLRENVNSWLPKRLFGSKLVARGGPPTIDSSKIDDASDSKKTLILSILATTHICEVLGSGARGVADFRTTLEMLIQKMSVSSKKERETWDCIVGLLEAIEVDTDVCQLLLNENTVYGLVQALANAGSMLDEAVIADERLRLGDKKVQSSLLGAWAHAKSTLLDCCVTGARIAESHPDIYVQSNEKMLSQGSSACSIAVNAWRLFEKGTHLSMDCIALVNNLVNLTLTELSISSTESEQQDIQRFASFGTISNLLKSADLHVVESVCAAISSYTLDASGGMKEKPGIKSRPALPSSVETHDEQPVVYGHQCDSCSLCPILGSRYTLLEGFHDIDLCKECFQIGTEFAKLRNYDPDVEVVIRGKDLRLGEASRLSCAQIKEMQPVPIARIIEEQVRMSKLDSGDIQTQIRRQETHEGEPNAMQRRKRENFVSTIFTDILEVLFSGGRIESLSHPVPLMQLALDIIFTSDDGEIELSRAKQLAKELTCRISHLLRSGHGACEEEEKKRRFVLVLCIRSLTSLLLQNHDALGVSLASAKDDRDPSFEVEGGGVAKAPAKEKTDPRFICDVHGVPAVRRRCPSGVDKDRRFYVCGLERKKRCKYFKWASDADETVSDDASVPTSPYRREMERFVWGLLCASVLGGSFPVHSQLCDMLQLEFISYEESSDVRDCRPSEVQSNGGDGKSSSNCGLGLTYDRHAALKDLNDGVLCSKQKLGVWHGRFVHGARSRTNRFSEGLTAFDISVATEGESSSIEACLDLLALVAEDCTQEGAESESGLNWFSILCEIMSSSSSSHFRELAKRVLKRLCGSRRSVYHSVTDRYVFGFQFEKLLQFSQAALSESILRREQARQCGSHWRTGETMSWQNIRAGCLIGTQDLLSEDCLSAECNKKISTVLDGLLGVTRNRNGNWRQFCGLPSISRSHRKKNAVHRTSTSEKEPHHPRNVLAAASCPPILSLLWVACSLSGKNQIKAFTLIELALNPCVQGVTPRVSMEDGVAADEAGEALSSDGVIDESICNSTKELALFSGGKDIAPEDALLGSPKGLTVDDIHGFIMQFVHKGNTPELRQIASRVAQSLCQNLKHNEVDILILRLVGAPLCDISDLGSDCIEFLKCLQGIIRNCRVSESLQRAARTAINCFMRQMHSLKQEPSGSGVDCAILETDDGGIVERKRFDLACCVHCHRHSSVSPVSLPSGDRTSAQETGASARSTRFAASDSGERGNSSAMSSREQSNDPPWLPDQVKPFVRGRLETSTEASVSNEFAAFVQLKFRLAVSNIYLSVNDPRSRFVKTIAVYFTPRQVSEVGTLKTAEYSSMWQRCATLSLTRGAARASCSLPIPVVAANLKFEYLEFYDKPGGSTRSSDGSLLLHCPRCTRIVNNAHGVCGNCGEVAFQCRKCRHINYDRLDAFLCVECGYCSSGGFNYELTAGIASNAVAITDDDAFSRALKFLRVATKLHEDLQLSLKKKVNGTKVKKRARGSDFAEIDALSAHSPSLKRAFLGHLPSPGGGKGDSRSGSRPSGDFRGSAVASIASSKRSESKSRVSAANKARSLLRLARQLRGDSSGTSERSRSGDFFVRQALLSSGRGLLVEDIEETGDMLGIINSTDGIDVLPMDSSDSLSRLVASIQSQSRASSGRDRGENAGGSGEGGDGGGGSNGGNATGDDSSPKAVKEECDRLYQLMREAERERFELQRRIDAWKRLEVDALAEFGSSEATTSFAPTNCSVCVGPVTLELLLLVMEVFKVGMEKVEETITRDFVRALFEEPAHLSKDLFDLKRLVLHRLATTSEIGGRLILSELKLRLRATNDVTSAEILGKLLRSDFSLVDEYVQLAMETLANST